MSRRQSLWDEPERATARPRVRLEPAPAGDLGAQLGDVVALLRYQTSDAGGRVLWHARAWGSMKWGRGETAQEAVAAAHELKGKE